MPSRWYMANLQLIQRSQRSLHSAQLVPGSNGCVPHILVGNILHIACHEVSSVFPTHLSAKTQKLTPRKLMLYRLHCMNLWLQPQQVLPLGASKGTGLLWLLNHLNVDPSGVMVLWVPLTPFCCSSEHLLLTMCGSLLH